MQLALCRPYTTAAVALAGAALVAATPAAIKAFAPQHRAVQLVDMSQQIADLGQSQIASGTALYNQGDLADGLASIINGENNLYVAAPQDLLLEQTETASQPYEFVYFHPDQAVPIPTDASQVTANIQVLEEIGQNMVNQGSIDTAAGLTNLGTAETILGTNDLTVLVPEEELYGPVFVSFANDPASYGADSIGYLTHEIESQVIGPISTFAEVAGINLGPVGDLLGAADAVQTLNAFTSHWDGYLAGNPVDAAHILVETPELELMAAGAMTAVDLPPVSIGLDAIATGFGGLDDLLNSWLGVG
jgi:hypothetical protein